MKKTIIILSAAVLVMSVFLTACGKKNDVLVDEYNSTHKVVTNDDGSQKQDSMGNLYEEVTDTNGNTVTQAYNFPLVTNKSKTKIENAVLKIETPDKWEMTESTETIRLRHKSGACTKNDISACQLDFSYRNDYTRDQLYEKYLNQVNTLPKLSDDITNVKDTESKILGKYARCVSYHSDSTKSTVYYFCVQSGYNSIEIIANVYDDCYTQDAVQELINSCCTLKDLGVTDVAQATTED